MAIVKFGNFTPASPDKYEVELSDMDGENAGRSETGFMNRDRVRAGIFKLSLGWSNLNMEEVTTLLDAVSPESVPTSFFFGQTIDIEAYAGNRKISLKHKEADGSAYWDVSFNMTEL